MREHGATETARRCGGGFRLIEADEFGLVFTMHLYGAGRRGWFLLHNPPIRPTAASEPQPLGKGQWRTFLSLVEQLRFWELPELLPVPPDIASTLTGGPNVSPSEASQPMSAGASPASPLVMRLIFEYEGEQVRLVSQHPVDIVITGFDLAKTQHPGYYVDSIDTAGKTLTRVPARAAFAPSLEVFPEQHGEPITRVAALQVKGAFTVIVPVPPGAEHVAVVRVAPAKPGAPQMGTRTTSAAEGAPEVTEMARFPLHLSR